ncbi:MAG: 23S rRNA pseudouridine(1911/1915/1917) synthase RluD [Gammaproteobacteria bacterium]|nr:23S rRNA pseudouridine(1911/1915/1917) synthase RluD [Gammaproteobacteria bacterium]
MTSENKLSASIPAELNGQRLDQALATLFPASTRSQLQRWIKEGHVQLNGRAPLKRDKVKAGDSVEIKPPAVVSADWKAEAIPLEIVYEDEDILVINKVAGLVVHPGAGNPEGTLLNALVNHAPKLAQLARAGIVHRLDKDTSGLLVVAKTESVRQNLIAQLQTRSVEREYLTIVNGVMVAGGTIDAAIGRHRTQRTRMAVSERGKPAVSHYRVIKKYRAHTLVQVKLESGRTHQIRVHMAHLNYPVVGDPVYGGRLKIPAGSGEDLKNILRGFKRQALHALKLGLIHPRTEKHVQWATSVPADMSELMESLAKDAKEHQK